MGSQNQVTQSLTSPWFAVQPCNHCLSNEYMSTAVNESSWEAEFGIANRLVVLSQIWQFCLLKGEQVIP